MTFRTLAAMAAVAALGAAARPAAARDFKPITNTGRPMDVAAIYFPSWHTDDHYSAWFGEGWNEWQLLKNNKEWFPGQKTNRPAWGYFDEADPKWMERQIDTAADNGVSVFVFDWYWYSGVQILNRPVEETLPKTPNKNRIKYALMWADHGWINFFPVPYKKPAHWLLNIHHSEADMHRVMAFCIKHHFNQKNYWRINGASYFSIFSPDTFISDLGGPEKTKALLQSCREQVEKAGLGSVHFAAVSGYADAETKMKAAGFDSVTTYNVTTMSTPVQLPWQEDYSSSMQRQEKYWYDMDVTGDLPYGPVVTVGWDVTPRWELDTPWPPDIRSYPYVPVTVGNTPERFGELLRKVKTFTEKAKQRPPAVFINAWNEWTEGSALLPGTSYGDAYLKEIKAVYPPRKK
jgi:hypothetical protein